MQVQTSVRTAGGHEEVGPSREAKSSPAGKVSWPMMTFILLGMKFLFFQFCRKTCTKIATHLKQQLTECCPIPTGTDIAWCLGKQRTPRTMHSGVSLHIV